jgi:hypothetical protein
LVAESLSLQGGEAAMDLRLAEQYIPQLGKIAREANTVVLPANLTDLGGVLAMAKGLFKGPNGSAAISRSGEVEGQYS